MKLNFNYANMKKENHLDTVKGHFEYTYRDYNRLIPKLVPGYSELKNSITEFIKSLQLEKANILDLGCGTAILGEEILTISESCVYYGVDISEHMAKEARGRLSKFGERAVIFQEDFFNLDKLNLPKLDVVVSMLAIHHFEDKMSIYQTIQKVVSANEGVFILSDLVIDPRKNKEVYQFRKDHMANEGMSEKEIDEWFQVFNEEDRPSTIEENFKYLTSVGFQPKVVWQNQSYATFVCKPKPN